MRQRLALQDLRDSNVLETLDDFSPILVGIVPIGIDISSSDLDIICYSKNINDIGQKVRSEYSKYKEFKETLNVEENKYTASFKMNNFRIEIYSENLETFSQHGFRHMLVEDRIIKMKDEKFKEKILELKNKGFKTEPAFGILLNLQDPYKDLLEIGSMSDDELFTLLQQLPDSDFG